MICVCIGTFRIARNHPKRYHLCQKPAWRCFWNSLLAAPSDGYFCKLSHYGIYFALHSIFLILVSQLGPLSCVWGGAKQVGHIYIIPKLNSLLTNNFLSVQCSAPPTSLPCAVPTSPQLCSGGRSPSSPPPLQWCILANSSVFRSSTKLSRSCAALDICVAFVSYVQLCVHVCEWKLQSAVKAIQLQQ